ncbi:MAG: DNA recombination protein RmuC [Pseudomonadota bacterium]
MNPALFILALLAGAGGGALLHLLISRGKLKAAREAQAAASSYPAEIAARDAHIWSRDQQIGELRSRLAEREAGAERLRSEVSELTAENTRLRTVMEEERKAAQEKLELVNEARSKLAESFRALSAEALENNNRSFLDLAKTNLESYQKAATTELDARQKAINEMVSPVKESLQKVDSRLEAFAKERITAETELGSQLKHLALTQGELKSETARLVRALRTPNVRGRWGEIQLKRVVEIAGMLNYCDFEEQSSATTEEGRLRPDLLVRLPGGKNIVVDAKAPLEAYLNALECEDDAEKSACMASHARQIQDHMTKLSSKAYWDQFQPTPEFVVMFLPGETFFSAALEQDPHLIEQGVNQKIILASPTTLIALLRAIAYGWQQETLAQNAEEIKNLGKELFDRLCTFSGYLKDLGGSLDSAISHYNKAIGSLETRVLVSARKFNGLGLTSSKQVPDSRMIEKTPRDLTAPEFVEKDDGPDEEGGRGETGARTLEEAVEAELVEGPGLAE